MGQMSNIFLSYSMWPWFYVNISEARCILSEKNPCIYHGEFLNTK